MNPYNLDITKIVKYACITITSIIGIIFSYLTITKIYKLDIEKDAEEWE